MKRILSTHQRGFTLIEITLAISLFSIIVVFVSIFTVFFFRNYSFSFEEQQIVGQSQQTLTQMLRDIRRIRMGEDGSWPIIQADDNSFIFFSDVDGDKRTERVRYFLSGSNLQKGVISPTTFPATYPLANEIVTTILTSLEATSSPLFRYYNGNWPADSSNNPLPLANRVIQTRYVIINLRVNPTPNFAANMFELSSGVSIRSLKSNL